jgi:hypothetical protein
MTEKAAYTAMKNLIALVKEPGAASGFTPQALSYTLTAPASVHHTLLQKSDGRFYMLVWNEVLSYDSVNKIDLNVADVAATLALDGRFDIKVYDPNLSATALATHANVASLNLDVPDQVTVLELTRVPEPASAALLLAAAGAFSLRRHSRHHR